VTTAMRQLGFQAMKEVGRSKDTVKRQKDTKTTPYRLGQGILIGSEWKITADKMNVILWRKEGKLKPRWRTEGYFSTIGNALIALVRQGVCDTELASIQTVQDRIVELEHDILRMAAGQ
jgi:hypothetical protein